MLAGHGAGGHKLPKFVGACGISGFMETSPQHVPPNMTGRRTSKVSNCIAAHCGYWAAMLMQSQLQGTDLRVVHQPRAEALDLLVGGHRTECDLAEALHARPGLYMAARRVSTAITLVPTL